MTSKRTAFICLEASAPTEFKDIFLGNQPGQDVKVFGRVGNYPFPQLQGVMVVL